MTDTQPTVLEGVLQRDRMVVALCLAGVVAAAWAWVLLGAGTGMDPLAAVFGQEMSDMADMIMEPAPWTAGYAVLIFAMWWVMMAAMMLPSAAPVLLLFARINRSERAGGRPYVPTGVFAAGYLATWGSFSALATGLEWALEQSNLISPMMEVTSRPLSAALLIAAGLWQFSPIKRVCLTHCRSPLSFLMQEWRPGRLGAFGMGLRHGGYCLGCCWFLMALLFVGGVMNLFWIAGLAAFVLVEKVAPLGQWFGRVAGLAAAAAGVLILVVR